MLYCYRFEINKEENPMKMRNIFVLVLALAMVFALCACGTEANEGENPATTAPTVTAPTEGTEPTQDDGKVTYTVKVVDEAGNPVVGAMVQLCKDTCVPTTTDANGVATWRLAEDAYKASFVVMPSGYTADQAEYYFAAGAYDMTITLKAA
jgi:hypothetical protein